MLRSPSAGIKLRLPVHCTGREVLSPNSMSIPAAHLQVHSHLWPMHPGKLNGTEISKLWIHKHELVPGVSSDEVWKQPGRWAGSFRLVQICGCVAG